MGQHQNVGLLYTKEKTQDNKTSISQSLQWNTTYKHTHRHSFRLTLASIMKQLNTYSGTIFALLKLQTQTSTIATLYKNNIKLYITNKWELL